MFTMQDFQNKLDEINFRYDKDSDGNIFFSQTGDKNFRYVIVVERQDDVSFKVEIHTGIEFPEYNFRVLDKINKYNTRYKWYSFAINSKSKNELVMFSYIDSQYTSSVEGLIDLIIMGIKIINDLYPDTQRLIWNS